MDDLVLKPSASMPVATYSKNEVSLILVAACLGWGLEFFDLQLLSLYAPSIMSSLHISTTTFGAVATVQLLGTAIGGVLFGLLADQYGRRNTLMWTILVFSISTFLVIFISNVSMLFILRFLTGLGMGGEWAIGYSLLNEAWDPKRRGLMGGIVQASIWPAYALAILVTQVVHNWHWGFAIGVLPALSAVWVRLKCPESKVWLSYHNMRQHGNLPGELKLQAKASAIIQIFKKDLIRFTLLGVIIVFGGQYAYYGLSQWMPTLLANTFHLTPGAKSGVLYLGSGIALLSYIGAGWLSDSWGRKKTFICFSVLTLMAYLGFSASSLSSPKLWMVVFWYVVFNIGLGYFGIFGTWFAELFPTRARATGSSFAYSVGRGLASAAPLVVGLLASTKSLLFGISTGVIAVLIMLTAIPFMVDRRGRQISAVE
ncbi:MAG: MFS transporter [Alicyclobacillus macrosporangiidus]|uniref:MFS transporter n=1 Tax=Alicyclobacillus macrosporangiidus TaxID=392015 RepID=UPI0026ED1518|nr:MFS transporter [Alicyclobacillus macrosporangiidus]MCL6599609.1 MFS transporter [Alicyclobacillus macrosporangiidus]